MVVIQGNNDDGFGDDDGMMREPQRQRKKTKTLVNVEAWGPPIAHFINLKLNPEQTTEYLLNISVSPQRKHVIIYARYIVLECCAAKEPKEAHSATFTVRWFLPVYLNVHIECRYKHNKRNHWNDIAHTDLCIILFMHFFAPCIDFLSIDCANPIPS